MRISTITLPAGRRGAVLLLAASLLQIGCSFHLFGGRSRVDVAIADQLNGGFPIAVDFVVVYSKELEQRLGAMTAQDWFAQRQQILRDSPGKALAANYFEWVPSQPVGPQRISYRFGARALLVFANYFSPGEHRQKLKVGQSFFLDLGERSFTIDLQR